MQPPADDAWDAWTPDQLFTRLGASAKDWHVVGGWALDLWHGTTTRAHEDLEFAVPADRAQHYCRTLSDLAFFFRDGWKAFPVFPRPAPDTG